MPTFTAFAGYQRVATGPVETVVRDVQDWLTAGGAPVLVFDDETGTQVDFDLRGDHEAALARLPDHPWLQRYQPTPVRSGPGRPKLGVVSREVSLLPQHWDWLNRQRGGASVTLRRLVDERMRQSQAPDRARQAHEAVSKVLWNLAGNLPDFEEATRAFARRAYGDFDRWIAAWPPDVRDHLRGLVAVAQQRDEEAGHGAEA